MTLDEILPFDWRAPLDDDTSPLLTPFETWCDRIGVHPESSGAWATYRRSIDAAI